MIDDHEVHVRMFASFLRDAAEASNLSARRIASVFGSFSAAYALTSGLSKELFLKGLSAAWDDSVQEQRN